MRIESKFFVSFFFLTNKFYFFILLIFSFFCLLSFVQVKEFEMFVEVFD